MALQQAGVPIHWGYFLALEDDLYTLARYVEISPQNYGTYSIEIARLLLSASAEVDSILKQLVKKVDPDARAGSITEYFDPITAYSAKFVPFRVSIPRHGLELQPWSDWEKQRSPAWWRAHTDVKHHRHERFDRATLQHCLNAMAGLLIALLHLHEEDARQGHLVGLPKLFTVPTAMGGGQRWGENGHVQMFYLNEEDNPARPRSAGPP